MIARVWKGVTTAADKDDYYRYLQETGLPGFRLTEGNQGAIVLRRVVDGQAEFIMISFWESLEASRRFGGDDPEEARFYPEDDRYLIEKWTYVENYQVMEANLSQLPEKPVSNS